MLDVHASPATQGRRAVCACAGVVNDGTNEGVGGAGGPPALARRWQGDLGGAGRMSKFEEHEFVFL